MCVSRQAVDEPGTSISSVSHSAPRDDNRPSDHEELLGTTLGVYRVEAPLGSGAVGVVYRAWDCRASRNVALKVLRAGVLATAADRWRFKQEAVALGRLAHRNVTGIWDFGTSMGRDYLVMEFVPGLTVSDLLGGAPLASAHVAFLGEQLAHGMAAAHRIGFIHRDIKPQNLRLTPDGCLKILDFGLAHMADQHGAAQVDSQDSSVVGTVPYMAPEQLRGGPVDARTDLYGAGTVLYEMACGRRPFTSTVLSTLIDDIQHRPPTPPSSLNPAIWPSLESVILRSLAKNPEDRVASARDLARQLKHVECRAARAGWSWLDRWRRIPVGLETLVDSLESERTHRDSGRSASLALAGRRAPD
jgi:eukaryotic-like serine/threonine-protein kinase